MKYKIRYFKHYQKGGSSNKESKYDFILLDGTSSSGKSTICDYFNKNGYTCIKGDDYSYCNPKVAIWSDNPNNVSCVVWKID